MTLPAAPPHAELSVDAMLARAGAETGLTDFGDEAFLEALHRLIDSSNRDVILSATGIAAVENDVHRILVNRLRFAADLNVHPEILDEDVDDPIVILGMPRTGTTKLQRMMSADPEVQRLDYWRLLNPAPFPGNAAGAPDPRIAAARQAVAMMNQLMPDWRASHPTEAEDVDEEVYLQTFTCKSIITCASRELPSYQAWMQTQSMRGTYAYMKQLLQYLQWQGGGKRQRPWIMKSPVHMGTVDLLLELFPKATLVFTHRDLYTATASICRLMENTWNLYAVSVDRHAIGRTVRELFLAQLRHHLVLRDRLGARLDILDVQYERIRSHSLDVIAEIYGRAGRELTPARRAAMLAWEAGNPQHSAGKPSYCLEDYGLTRADIEADCGAYLQRFSVAP